MLMREGDTLWPSLDTQQRRNARSTLVCHSAVKVIADIVAFSTLDDDETYVRAKRTVHSPQVADDKGVCADHTQGQ